MNYVSPATLHSGIPALAAGISGQPEVIRTALAAAVGKIVFTGNLIAGDTVTINGKVFTCMASGAAGEFQFNVAGSLSLSLDALVIVLNACTDVLVSIATYSKTDTNTALTMTVDAAGVLGNTYWLTTDHVTAVLTQPTGGAAIPVASVATETTLIDFATSLTGTVHLPDGVEGQRKAIAMAGLGTANVISPNDMLPGSTNQYAMNGADALVLQWLGGKWRLLLNDGAVAT